MVTLTPEGEGRRYCNQVGLFVCLSAAHNSKNALDLGHSFIEGDGEPWLGLSQDGWIHILIMNTQLFLCFFQHLSWVSVVHSQSLLVRV